MLAELYQPDERWPLLGIPTREEYVRSCVPLAPLPAHLPEDVQKSFRTVVHLVALAWYHYPLIDEALKKLFGMAEMAVKIRCQQLAIPLSITHKNKERPLPLATLITQLCTQLQRPDLETRLHSIRNIRNSYAHPGHHFYAGITAVSAIQPIAATIAQLFATE